MAFDRKYLYCVGPAAGPRRHWHYDTLDTQAAMDSADYFLGAINELNIGDVIFAVTWTTAIGIGGTVAAHATDAAGILVVREKSATSIDCGNANPMTTVDSD